MTALERVMQLKREGKGEGEIIAVLRNEGVNPMQISDALNQSKIKEAINDPNPASGMTPSMMAYSEEKPAEPQQAQAPQQEYYVPQETQKYAPEQQYAPQQYYGQGQQYEESYESESPGEEYYEGGEYAGAGNYSTDTMIEVAEQVFSEKIKKISKDLEHLNEFKTIFEMKVENINERLKRMEKNFDSMQLNILGKVGEYGKGLDYLKKELDMVQDNFGKVMKGL